jgi:hypothetical protein
VREETVLVLGRSDKNSLISHLRPRKRDGEESDRDEQYYTQCLKEVYDACAVEWVLVHTLSTSVALHGTYLSQEIPRPSHGLWYEDE